MGVGGGGYSLGDPWAAAHTSPYVNLALGVSRTIDPPLARVFFFFFLCAYSVVYVYGFTFPETVSGQWTFWARTGVGVCPSTCRRTVTLTRRCTDPTLTSIWLRCDGRDTLQVTELCRGSHCVRNPSKIVSYCFLRFLVVTPHPFPLISPHLLPSLFPLPTITTTKITLI